jgi:stage III sporulation protein AE
MKYALFLCLLSLFSLRTAAQDTLFVTDTLQRDYQSFLESIPPEIAELLPEGFFATDLTTDDTAVSEAGSIHAILRTVGKLTGLTVAENLALFAKICGLLLLAAVFRALGGEKKGEVGRAYTFCCTLSMAVLLLCLQRGKLEKLELFFDTIKKLCTALLPMMSTLFAMGGNLRHAVVNHSALSFFLTILETLCAGTVLPVAGICLSFALLDAITGRARLRGVAGVIKRTYTLTISFFMGILCFVLGTQSTLAKASDTLALRTARFAAGSFLPLVGGSLSETLRTVAGSVAYLRAVVGTSAVTVLFLTFLPTFLSVLLTRIALMLGGAVANLLSCDSEGILLGELSSVYGYFLAIISVLFVALTFSLTLFAQCAAAG